VIGRIALLVTVAVLWGVPYLFIKTAVEAGLSPFLIVFIRVGIGSVILLPFAVRGVTSVLAELVRRWRPLLGVAVIDVAVPFVLISIGERSVSSSLAGILVAATPLFIAVLARWVDASERPDRGQLLGLLLGFAGVAVLLGGGPGGGTVLGAGLILLASFGYALATLIVKRYFSDLPPVAVTGAVLGLSTALLAVPAALTWPYAWPAPGVLSALFALGTGCTGLAFLCYYALVTRVGAARAAVSTYLAPGFAVLAGVTVLGEIFTARAAAGLGLILLSSWLSSRPQPSLLAAKPSNYAPSNQDR
jgi:drug/metabolite transporter (DMT)-like permease